MCTPVIAQDAQEIQSNLYRLEDLVRNNTLRIERRGLAPEINQIILDAYAQIEESLTRRPGRRPGRGDRRPGDRRPGRGDRGGVDMTLVSVALSSCSSLGTWSGRNSCYTNYFSTSTGLLGTIYRGCSAINSDQYASNCFTSALQAVQSGVEIETVAKAGCGTLGTWSSRKRCFDGMMADSYSYVSSILYGACSQVSSDQQGSECYNKGLGTGAGTSSAQLLVAACGSLGTWSSRVQCYRSGVDTADSIGERLGLYVRGCVGISSDSQAANCYTRSLQAIQ